MSPIRTVLAVLLLASSVAATAQMPRGEAVVYEGADFRGRSVALRDDMGNFALVGFNDRAASLYVMGGTWEFCTDAYYRGSCRLYEPGQYRNLGGQARRISSGRLVGAGQGAGHALRPGEGRWQDVGRGDVSVFDAQDFRGFLATLSDPVRDFDRLGINDKVASLIVNRGTWEFCTDAQFRGTCHVYGPGEYRALPGRDDAYSSARPVQPGSPGVISPPIGRMPPDRWRGARPRIALFDANDFHGRSIWLDGPMDNLEFMDFNDCTRSIVVEVGTWRLCSDAAGEGECHDLGPGRYPAIPRGLHGRLSSVRLR
jgi:hypothetical protein